MCTQHLKLPIKERPSITRYNNRYFNFIGKLTKFISDSILRVTDDGSFNADYFEINNINIPTKHLGEEFNGYRILQFSDIHLGTWINEERLHGVIELVNNLYPDLICITGDFITHIKPESETILTDALSKLDAPDGTIAVLGNHDYWSDPHLISKILETSGIELLRNQTKIIHKNGDKFAVAGVDDVYNNKDNLHQIINQLPEDVPTLLLVHVPDFAEIAASTGKFFLSLSGHSHGGQVVFPLLGEIVLPPLGRKYSRGLYMVNTMYHYTNKGVGTATIPIRWNCKPEITVFEIKSE